MARSPGATRAPAGPGRRRPLRPPGVRLVGWARGTVTGAGMAVVTAAFAQNVGNFAFHAAASQIVGPARYGALGAVLTLTVALSIPLGALQVALTRAVAEGETDADADAVLRRIAMVALVAGVIVCSLAPVIRGFLRLESIEQAALLGPYVFVAAIAGACRGTAIGRGCIGVAAGSIAAATVARLAVGIAATAWIGLTGALIGTIAAEVVAIAVVARPALVTGSRHGSVPLARADLVETSLVTVGIWLLGSVDVMLARHYLLGADSGLYVAAGTAARAVLLLPQALAAVAVLRFVRRPALEPIDDAVDAWASLRDTLALAFALTVAGAAAVAVAGPQLLSTVFGSGYADSGPLLAWLALGTLPTALTAVLAMFHLARRSRLAFVPWMGAIVEVIAIAFWHGSPVEIAQAALVALAVQTGVLIALVVPERRHALAHSSRTLRGTCPSRPTTGLRILVYNWRDLSHPAAGGAEVYVDRIARRWCASGHDVTLFCAAVPGRPEREDVHGVHVVRRGGRLSVYREARRFWRTEGREAYDLVVDCINTRPFGTVRFASPTPVVAIAHQVAREVWWYEAPFLLAALGRFLLEPRWLRRYRHTPVLTISDSSRVSLERYGLRRVAVVPVGVDIHPGGEPLRKAPHPTVVFCSRLVPSKRPEHALAAFTALRTRLPEARLVVVGTGPQERRLRASAPPNVEFVGRVTEREKRRLIGSAHALIATSVREGWGLVVSEAAALGTPAVGYDVAGLRDSLSAANGRLSAPNPVALAEILGDVLPHWVADPPPRLAWGGAACWDEVASSVLDAALSATGLATRPATPPEDDSSASGSGASPRRPGVETAASRPGFDGALASVVVVTKDAARTLDACLSSIAMQDYPFVELIVVDNSSTDETLTIARRHAHTVVHHGPERSAQRNRGAELGHGEVLVFIDADMVLQPSVVGECVEALARSAGTGALVLPELSFGRGYFARCRALEKELYLGDHRVEAARAFRRDVFDAAGGYDTALNAFEDWDLADRVRARGGHVGRIEAQVWHDDGVVSPLRQFRKKRYYGRQSGRYLARRRTPRRRRIVRTSLWRHPRRLARHAWLVPGLVWLKLCEATGILLGSIAARRAAVVEVSHRSAGSSGLRPRILHLVGSFDSREGIGRSIIRLTEQVPGEHHVLSARIGRGAHHFVTAHEVGGSMATFPLLRARKVRAAIRTVGPDVIHLHGGPLVSAWAPLPMLRARRMVASIYVWPRLPSLRALRRVRVRAAVRAQVLRPRVVASTMLGGRGTAFLLRRGGVRHVLTPDRAVVERLGTRGIDVTLIPGAVAPDARRARADSENPVIVFAGRAETVRGIDTLLDAVPLIRRQRPTAKVRLLLLDRAELEAIAREVERRGLHDAVQVVSEPTGDLRGEFAEASVAAFPFKFDHVTIPPALTLAEAMSVGLPVVATDVACINALLRHDENGLIVPIDAPSALAAAIERLLRDPLLWERLSCNAVNTIEQSAERFGSQCSAAYGTWPAQVPAEASCAR